NATTLSRSDASLTSPDTTFVSRRSVPPDASSSQRSTPARLPVVAEAQASAVPGLVSCTLRSGLRKFTGAKRRKRLPVNVNFPCHTVSRPRPRYSARCHNTRTQRPRSAAVKRRTVRAMRVPCSPPTRSIWRGADDLDGEPHRHRAGPDDVAHRRLAHGEFLSARELQVFGKRRDRLVEGGAQIEKQPRPGGAVVAAP